jgi:serine/threonine protein kinase
MSVSTVRQLVDLVRKSDLVPAARLEGFLEQPPAVAALGRGPKKLANLLVREGLLTIFQATQLLQGKWRGFLFGNYRVLERLGRGGQSTVYLCVHTVLGRRVALKVLPLAQAENPAAVARFHREARAAAALDHPNIAHAYDSGTEGDLHFLVTAYVDGSSLQEIVENHGPLDVIRAAHYVRQAALGMQHIYEAGLVHRDIKPGNLLLDRRGVVRVLDLGLARFFHDHQDVLTVMYDGNRILGTADYLSPEQARDSHDVDIRTDVYSLGGTFYFLLTGRPPFLGRTVAQKLLAHQTKEPTPVRELRPEVPKKLAAVLDRMMAKDPAKRYPTPAAVAAALAPWTRTPTPPPPEAEMPRLCRAALAAGSRHCDSRWVQVGSSTAAVGSPGKGGPPEPSWDGDRPSTDAGSSPPSFPDQARSGNGDRQPPATGAADTDPALARCDTDPQLSKIFGFGPSSPRPAPPPRTSPRHPIAWLVTAGVIGAAALAWLLLRWVLAAP